MYMYGAESRWYLMWSYLCHTGHVHIFCGIYLTLILLLINSDTNFKLILLCLSQKIRCGWVYTYAL